MRAAGLLAASAAAALLACGGDDAPASDDASERELSTGRVVGFVGRDDAHVWRGIPYAEPPVGALRWRAPRPPQPWDGVREATAFGAECPQFEATLGGDEPDVVGSEDCLFLNVFAPRFDADEVPAGDARLPVMVWIHGGGNSIGSADLYDLGKLAVEQRVIAVAVHYRLGLLGWFRHPALHARGESLEDRSGNYGTLDLVRALEWVQREIGAFGGDPERVTVFGESAGGTNVYSLLLSRSARGLFARAIVQSGSLRTHRVSEAVNYRDDPDAPGHPMSSREVAVGLVARREELGRNAAKRRLEAMAPEAVAEMLRGAEPAELLATLDGSGFGGLYRGPFLVRDGRVLPRTKPMTALGAGAYNRVPVIVGSNRDEEKLFLVFSHDSVRRVFGLPLWLRDEARYERLASYRSRMWKAAGVDAPAAAMARVQRRDVHAYRFDWDEEPTWLFSDFSKLLGAAHVLEVPFVLGRIELGRATRFVFDAKRRDAAEALARAIQSYWGEFAHTGAPGRGRSGDLPEWPAWNPRRRDAPKYAVLDTEDGGGIRMSSAIESEEALLAEVAADEGFASDAERCEVYAGWVRRSLTFGADDYERIADGACVASEGAE